MRKKSIEEKWHEQSEAAKAAAARLVPGSKKQAELLREARQLDTASHMNDWLSSPGLSPPK
jgi:hypothetical protein